MRFFEPGECDGSREKHRDADAENRGVEEDEVASDDALAEVARILRAGGRFVVADWSANGDGEAGPPLEERFDADATVRSLRDAGFDIEFRATRPETFLVVGVLDE